MKRWWYKDETRSKETGIILLPKAQAPKKFACLHIVWVLASPVSKWTKLTRRHIIRLIKQLQNEATPL